MLRLKDKSVFSKLFLFSLFLSFIFLGLVWPGVSYAASNTWNFLANILATPVYWLAALVGELLNVVIYFFVIIAQYNDIITADPVQKGWVIVRDLCNMFFVVVLLVIAFGTVLKVETYHYKRLLPKFLLMAILINFSKTIAGLFIDAAQIIMLTFVAGFVSITGGNLTDALQVSKYVTFSETTTAGAEAATLFASAVLALIIVIISLIVVVIMTIILVFRIVALWILVILSPLAYLLSIVPAGQKYASQWWQQFTKYLIVGPIMAFFLWLSLTTASTISEKMTTGTTAIKPSETAPIVQSVSTGLGTWNVLGSYIIGICLLVGSLVAAQQIGVAGGKMAGDWAGRIQRTGVSIGRGTARRVGVVGVVGGALAGPLGVVGGMGARWAVKKGGRAGVNVLGERMLVGARERMARGEGPGVGGVIGGWMHDAAQKSYAKQARETYKRYDRIGMGSIAVSHLRTLIGGREAPGGVPEERERVRRPPYTHPITGHRGVGEVERDTLRGAFRNFFLRNIYRSTAPGIAQEAQTRKNLAQALSQFQATQQQQPPAPPPPAGAAPFVFDKEKYEEKKKQRTKFRDDEFNIAQAIHEPEEYIRNAPLERQGLLIENLEKEREFAFRKNFLDQERNIVVINFTDLQKQGLDINKMLNLDNKTTSKEILGFHVNEKDRNTMKIVADTLIRAIDEKLKSSKSEREIKALTTAKEKFSTPENLREINVMNNENNAWRMSGRAAMAGTLHEMGHGKTAEEKKVTGGVTEAMETKQYREYARETRPRAVEEILEKEKEEPKIKEENESDQEGIKNIKQELETSAPEKNFTVENAFWLRQVAKKLGESAIAQSNTTKQINNLVEKINNNSTAIEINLARKEVEKKLSEI